ncbi:MAG: hypothetical protein E6Q83_05200 [Thiothrix sp.]|nr:MAG: hypothetical protein E6Q83_05200 [Thiothrix sp.]
MRFQTSLGLTALVSALIASPVYAENCSISYYCYRSMMPGPAPVAPVATTRPAPAGSTRPTNLQQPRPVTPPATNRTQPPSTTVARPAIPAPSQPRINQRLIEQQRAQTLADQQRLAELRRNTTTSNNRPSTPTPQTPVRVSPPSTTTTSSRPVLSNQSCNTLALKIKVLESQATSHARNQQPVKAQELFKVAADLRKEAKLKACTI